MSVSLSNRKDIIADSVGLTTENQVVDVGDGLVSTALVLQSKADKATVYAKRETYNREKK